MILIAVSAGPQVWAFGFGKLLHVLRLRRGLNRTTKSGGTTCGLVLASRLPKTRFIFAFSFAAGVVEAVLGPGLSQL